MRQYRAARRGILPLLTVIMIRSNEKRGGHAGVPQRYEPGGFPGAQGLDVDRPGGGIKAARDVGSFVYAESRSPALGLPNTSPPPDDETVITSPSRTESFRIDWAIAFSSFFCMRRFSGRAP